MHFRRFLRAIAAFMCLTAFLFSERTVAYATGNTIEYSSDQIDKIVEQGLNTRKRLIEVTTIKSLITGESLNVSYGENTLTVQSLENTVTYYFQDDHLSSIQVGDDIVNIILSDNKYDGIEFNGIMLYYRYDDTGNVASIVDLNDQEVIKYTYKGLTNKSELLDERYAFISRFNPIRASGLIFESLSGMYISGKVFFNPTSGKFEMKKIYSPNVSDYEIVQTLYNLYMSDHNMGKPIKYSTNWYTGLTDVEQIARCIYGECNDVIGTDAYAIAWELMNRKAANWSRFHSSGTSNTIPNIVRYPSAYNALTLKNVAATEAARMPDTSTQRWAKSLWSACTLIYSSSRSDLKNYVAKPSGIDIQCYHISNANPEKWFFGTTAETFSTSLGNITNVVIVGRPVGITSVNTLIQYSNNGDYNKNVFFNYPSEPYYNRLKAE